MTASACATSQQRGLMNGSSMFFQKWALAGLRPPKFLPWGGNRHQPQAGHTFFAAWTRCDLVGLGLIFFFLFLGNILSCWISHVLLLLLTRKNHFFKCKWVCKILVERHICSPCPVTTIILPLPHSAFSKKMYAFNTSQPSWWCQEMKTIPSTTWKSPGKCS